MTKHVLRPYADLVRRRVEKNPDNPIWAACDDRWLAVVDHAKGILGVSNRGVAGLRNERTAANAIAKVAAQIEPRDAVHTILAMYMMSALEPRRFASDDAFRVQLVRRVMRLSDVNVGEWYDHKSGRTKRAYRDFAPGAALIIASWLVQTLGVVGLHIAKLHLADVEKAGLEKADFHKALADLT